MKRLIALLLALVLLLALTACGENGDANTTANTTPTNTSAATNTPTPGEPAETDEPAIYPLVDGETILTLWTQFQPALSANGLLETWADHTVFKEFEKLTGVTIEFYEVAMTAKAEQFSITVSGNDLPDMFREAGNLYGKETAIEDEILRDLTAYLDYAPNYVALLDSDETYWPQAVNGNGEIAEFYCFTTEGAGALTEGAVIRQDWLDDLGLEIPYTYNEWYDTLLAFKTNYDISAAISFAAAGSNVGLEAGFRLGMFYWNLDNRTENAGYLLNKNGTAGLSIAEESYKDFVAMLAKWYDDGLISRDFISFNEGDNSPQVMQLIYTGETGIWKNALSNINNTIESSTDPNMKITALAKPVFNKGDETYDGQISVANYYTGLSVTTGCANPELAVRWLDAWYSDEGFLITNYGEEDVTYTLDATGYPQFTDLVLNNDIPTGLACILYTSMTPIGSEFIGMKRADIVRLATTYSDTELEMVDTWQSNTSKEMFYNMPAVSLTTDEADAYNLKWAEVSTYARENIAKFVIGERSMDEYDAYRAELLRIGGQECIDIYQAALGRYLSAAE